MRAENILVGKDAKPLWLIDFEDPKILDKDVELGAESRISQENKSVRYLVSINAQAWSQKWIRTHSIESRNNVSPSVGNWLLTFDHALSYPIEIT